MLSRYGIQVFRADAHHKGSGWHRYQGGFSAKNRASVWDFRS